jgi:hypothetical protein
MKPEENETRKTPLKNHQKSSPVIPPGVNRSRVTQMKPETMKPEENETRRK